MATLLNEYREARAAFENSKKKLDALQATPELKKALDFEAQLRALMGKYSMSLVDINQLLDTAYKPPKVLPKPAEATTKVAPKAKDLGKTGKPRKTRATRTYTNPNNGEKIIYVGGINKQLEVWKEKWGADVVKGWGILNK